MVYAAVCVLIVGGVVASATASLRAGDDGARSEFSLQGQAHNVAEAGLVDAYAWFRRQQVQPVTSFAPQRNLTANPPVNETDDPAQGLVRTFEISPGLWARYVVSGGLEAEPYADANANGLHDEGEAFVDVNGDGLWSPAQGTLDVTEARGLGGQGTVWRLVSKARIFRMSDADVPLGEGVNVQVAETRLAAEVRRLSVAPPAYAALCSRTSGAVTIGSRARLRSTGACVAYGTLTTSPSFLSGSELLGSPVSVLVPGWSDTVEKVFSVDWPTLQSMADISTSDPAEALPAPLPTMSLVVVTGNAVFDAERPLRGTAMLVVRGNVTIDAGSNSFFNGLLYVDGNLTVRAPALLRGAVIVTGTVDIRGTGGDFVEVEHDPALLSRLMTAAGQYRYSKATYPLAYMLPDGRPDESVKVKGKNTDGRWNGHGLAKGHGG